MKAGSFTWSGGSRSQRPSQMGDAWEFSLQNDWGQLRVNPNVCYLGKVVGENEMLDTKTNYYCQVRKENMVESITEPPSCSVNVSR